MKKDAVLSDEEIIELFMSRDENAVKALSAAYGMYLKSIAFNILKNREDCEECLNDAYYSLWNHIPPVRPKSLRAYASITVRNVALNQYKKSRRNGMEKEITPIDELAMSLYDPVDTESAVDEAHLKAVLNRFLSQRSETEQYIFVCRFYCFDSVRKIARSLRVSNTSVYNHIAKMKNDLAEELRREGISC